MLTLQSSFDEFQNRFEELKEDGSSEEIREFYQKSKKIRNSLWTDYIKTSDRSIRSEYEQFAELIKNVRRFLIKSLS